MARPANDVATGVLHRAVAVVAVAGVVSFLWDVWPWEDEVTEICETVLWFRDSDITFTLAKEDYARAFVDSCRAVWGRLDVVVQERIRLLHRSTHLESSLLTEFEGRLQQRKHGTCSTETGRASPEELEEEAEAYRRRGYMPLKARHIDLKDVAHAFAHGMVARVDGRRLVPPQMFNVTAEDLAQQLPGEESKRVPIFLHNFYGGWSKSCLDGLAYLSRKAPEWGTRSMRTAIARRFLIPWLLRVSCPKPAPSLSEVAGEFQKYRKEDLPWSLTRPLTDSEFAVETQMLKEGRVFRPSNLNIQRLPRLARQLDVASKIGLKDLVELTHTFLWMGETPGGWHADQQDNILVQLTGRADVFVWPSNCSGLVLDKIAFRDSALSWSTRDMPRGEVKAPFFHVILRSGQALVMPSGSAHKVIVRENRRVAANFFFEPRFGYMQWPRAPNNNFNIMTRNSQVVRILWLQALRHVWKTRRVAMVMHTEKMEFL